MAEIKANEVQKLRKMTGAGMMDCKKALQESDGDVEQAIEIIRKKGQAVASKRAEREAGEGVVLARAAEDRERGVMIVLNCETDFVAKNKDFLGLANSILDFALEKFPPDLDALKNLSMEGRTVSEHITDQTGVIGEKIDLSLYGRIQAEQITAYIHPGNKVSGIVGLNKAVEDPQVGKDVAMQVAAMDPIAVDKDDVPQEVIEKEKQIGREQAKQEGKPEKLLDRIAEGKLNKFFKEKTLLNQEFIKESKKSVRQYLQEHDKELTVTGFLRYSLKD